MHLIAYRSEYRLYFDESRNMLLYERLEELTFATELPYYLLDWQRALTKVRPGFTVLCDVRLTLGPNTTVLPTFLRAYELMLAAGIAVMAEVYPDGPTRMAVSQKLRQLSPLPTRQFTDLADAEGFLQSYSTTAAS
ncbi:hypothetical protein SAMN06265337_2768 [Hymenobacter gelipurpurascens]|uniref:SpoIIAA-like n=1 Tax=Hymenobacter gelipurpurascens TaxID=89968 RepID=A0A212UAK3_9BACT|nr:hypothetical protein [Hymenobacter gelipurpurascens]SNC75226.1 hypothetical protein SAMN06265337_2768 [Hymenobacter gelipurpurascens]